MDPELSLQASIKNCSMWRIETNTRLAYEKLGLPFRDDNAKLLVKKSDASYEPPKNSKSSSDSTSEDSEKSLPKIPVCRYKTPRTGPLQVTDLPPELMEHIFRKLTFENVAKIRTVCHHFNNVASSLLNSEFCSLRASMLHRFQNIKAQMPRRESARRKHPLARESDIIETLHMRLTLLHMTFGKHIERRHCCFFAGEILDEVYRILRYVNTTTFLNRAYKVTDELFDLSQMAMEYFKEHIEPSLPEITYFATDFLEYTPTITSSPKTQVSLLEDSVACTSSVVSKIPSLESMSAYHMPMNSAILKKKLRRLNDSIKKNHTTIFSLRKELKSSKRKVFMEQKQINELKSRCQDYDRKFQNTSRKFSAVLQELNRFKTEFQYWRSKSPATPCSCGAATPVLEMKDCDLLVPDLFPEKMSPRSNPELIDDFKPISPDILPSLQNVFEINDDISGNKDIMKSCKRKLDLDEYASKSMKMSESIQGPSEKNEVADSSAAISSSKLISKAEDSDSTGQVGFTSKGTTANNKVRKLCKRRKKNWTYKKKKSDAIVEKNC